MSDDVLEVAQATEATQSTEIADDSDTSITSDTSDTSDTANDVDADVSEQTVETAPAATAVTVYPGHPGQDHIERMRMIMLGFIDDPRKAALDADALLAEVLRSLTDSLARRRQELETKLSDPATPETERLRQIVRRSRELVDVLTQAQAV